MEEKSSRLAVLCLVAALVVLPFLAGCSGVIMNAEYSTLLDKTVALSVETATRAKTHDLTEEQMTEALVRQSETWVRFQQARDGKADEK